MNQGEGCRVRKALYGLKQSPKHGLEDLLASMKKFDYKQSNSDHTLFLRKKDDRITCLVIYVDDVVITRNDSEEISELERRLFLEFEMKDLGNLKYFLRIEVIRSKIGIFINQRKYILDLLAETEMMNCKPAEKSIVTNHGFQIIEGAEMTDQDQY